MRNSVHTILVAGHIRSKLNAGLNAGRTQSRIVFHNCFCGFPNGQKFQDGLNGYSGTSHGRLPITYIWIYYHELIYAHIDF